VIPGNDDAIRAIKLICGKIADAIAEVNQAKWDEEELARMPAVAPEEVPDGLDKPDVDSMASPEEAFVTAAPTLIDGGDVVIPRGVEDEYTNMGAVDDLEPLVDPEA